MHYEPSLHFLLGTLKRCGIPAYTFQTDTVISRETLGLQLLGAAGDATLPLLQEASPATVYSFSDRFGCNYTFFRLPDTSCSLLIIGPYLPDRPDEQALLSLAEQLQLSPKALGELRNHINSVSVLPDDSPIHLMLEQFYDILWGTGEYKAVNAGFLQDITMLPDKELASEDNLWNAQLLEQRYAMENSMLLAVAMGQLQKAERGFARFSPDFLEERTPDTLRNTKNYCIIMNTLFRKAAEQGGVHPIYLDQLSSRFAARIEQLPSLEKLKALMLDMCVGYCKLVRKHAGRQYSPLVQKAVVMIEGDPSAELTLHYLAGKLNVSNAYLSAAFKKETGQTVTAYIRRTRMALARRLLRHTNLQVQTVALHCGIVDVQYFSKLFKEDTGKTPTQFRLEGEKA